MSERDSKIEKAAREIVAEWLAQPPEAQTFMDLAVRAMRALPAADERGDEVERDVRPIACPTCGGRKLVPSGDGGYLPCPSACWDSNVTAAYRLGHIDGQAYARVCARRAESARREAKEETR